MEIALEVEEEVRRDEDRLQGEVGWGETWETEDDAGVLIATTVQLDGQLR